MGALVLLNLAQQGMEISFLQQDSLSLREDRVELVYLPKRRSKGCVGHQHDPQETLREGEEEHKRRRETEKEQEGKEQSREEERREHEGRNEEETVKTLD